MTGSTGRHPRAARAARLPVFVSAATLARVADEMFSVGVVLLVLAPDGPRWPGPPSRP